MTPQQEWTEAYAALIDRVGPAKAQRHPTVTYTRVLVALALKDPEPLFVRQLVDWLGINQENVSSVLRRMHRAGLTEREREDGDMRVLKRGLRTYYRLTDAGRSLARVAAAAEES